MGMVRFLLWGTEIQPEAHSWRALGTGLPPGEVPQGRGESWAGGLGVLGAFGAHHTGASGRGEAQAGAEGASWTGLTAPLGDATWIGRWKGIGSLSSHWISAPKIEPFHFLTHCCTPVPE